MHRLAFKHNNKFSAKMVRAVIFNLVELVEKCITDELKDSGRGAIIHDGWSKFCTHYMALFVQFQRKTKQRIGNQVSTMHIPASVLLAMRPMKRIVGEERDSFDDDEMPKLTKCVLDDDESDDEDEEEEAEATNFTAEVHANFFREVFKKYDLDINQWPVCQVS